MAVTKTQEFSYNPYCPLVFQPENNPTKNPITLSLSSMSSIPPMIYLSNQADENGKEKIQLLKNDIEQKHEKTTLLTKKKIEILDSKSIKEDNLSYWKTAQKISSYFSYTLSTLSGLAVLAATPAAAPYAATFLTASGIVGLANRISIDTGNAQKIISYFVKPENVEKTIQTIDQSLSTCATLLGVASFFYGSVNISNTILKTISVSSTIFSSVTSYQIWIAKSEVESSKSELSHLETKQTSNKNTVIHQISELDEEVKREKGVFSKVFSMLQDFIEALKHIKIR
jgi:hypothetical protein